MRIDRKADQLRPHTVKLNSNCHAAGSALITLGSTVVLCTATVEDRVPPFLIDSGKGWLTAEYAMLPTATNRRTIRERRGASGRTMEIQRLIGRSLRSVVDLKLLSKRTIIIDCDVLQADGGTRCAAITGGYIALREAVNSLLDQNRISEDPIKGKVAAVSVGLLGGEVLLDLDYNEDSKAEVDMNIVMTDADKFVEIQGTAESEPFDNSNLEAMLKLAKSGIRSLYKIQGEEG
ncbi:MAG: ribonuclease PH [Nitrospinota bacterium]